MTRYFVIFILLASFCLGAFLNAVEDENEDDVISTLFSLEVLIDELDAQIREKLANGDCSKINNSLTLVPVGRLWEKIFSLSNGNSEYVTLAWKAYQTATAAKDDEEGAVQYQYMKASYYLLIERLIKLGYDPYEELSLRLLEIEESGSLSPPPFSNMQQMLHTLVSTTTSMATKNKAK